MDKNIKQVIITLIICICALIVCCDYLDKLFKERQKQIVQTKIEQVDSLKNVIVIYKDSIKDEISKVDYISADSATKLFIELSCKPSLYGR